MPKLNHGRSRHSSIALDGTLYVMGGYGIKSIESLKIDSASAWQIVIDSKNLVRREYAAIAAIKAD